MEKEKIIVAGLVFALVISGIFGGASYSKYSEIKGEYDSLVKEHNESNANWQRKYNNLQNQYNNLQSNYNNLQNQYNNLQSNYNNLQNQYNNLQSNYNNLQNQYNNLQNQYNSLNNTYHNYKDMVEMRMPDTGAEKRGFLTPDDDSVKTKAASILGGGFDGSLSAGDIDKINDWVYNHIDYNHDVYVGKKGKIGKECWQYPSETLSLGYGDCEDQALLVISMCLAEEKAGWLYCAEVEFTKGSEKINHVCIFIDVQDDKMTIVDPTLKNDDWLNPGGWISTEARHESSALDDYRKAMGADSIRVKSVFNMNVYKPFSNNEAFYNWF